MRSGTRRCQSNRLSSWGQRVRSASKVASQVGQNRTLETGGTGERGGACGHASPFPPVDGQDQGIALVDAVAGGEGELVVDHRPPPNRTALCAWRSPCMVA